MNGGDDISVRFAEQDDLDAIAAIYAESFDDLLDELAGVLYDMLPGSGNPRLSFPTVAGQLGLSAYWTGGSKRPAIVTLLTGTFERERHRFCDLIEGVVRQSVSWRAGKGNPLTRDEIEDINRILARLGYKIPGLHDPEFLASLERRKKAAEGQPPPIDPTRLSALKSELVTISGLEPRRRGILDDSAMAR